MSSKYAHLFLLHNEGTVRTNMYRELYEQSRVFREALEHCLSLFTELSGNDFLTKLYPEILPGAGPGKMDIIYESELSQPLQFGIQYALIALFRAMGIVPALTAGYGYGNFLSMWLSGTVSLPDAVRLAAAGMASCSHHRDLQRLLIWSVNDDVRQALESERVVIRARVGEGAYIVEGGRHDIEQATRFLQDLNIPCRRYSRGGIQDIAVEDGNGSHVRPARPDDIAVNEPAIPFLSGTGGEWLNREKLEEIMSRPDPEPAIPDMSPGLKVIEKMQDIQILCISTDNHLADVIRICYPGLEQSLLSTGYTDSGPGKTAAAGECSLLTAINTLWESGTDLDWQAMGNGARGKLVPLPTYPYQRKNFTLPDPPGETVQSGAGDPNARKTDINDWFYRRQWALAGQEPEALPAPNGSLNILVLGDDSPLVAESCRIMSAQGHEVIETVLHERFEKVSERRFRVNGERREDFDELFHHLTSNERMPDVVVYAWGMATSVPGRFLASLDLEVKRGIVCLTRLLQSHSEKADGDHCTFKILTANVQKVTAAEQLNPLGAVLHGASKVIDIEFFRLDCQVLDIDPSQPAAPALLARHLLVRPQAPVVALRNGLAFVPEYVPEAPAADERSMLTQGGTYIVTGGLGGMGLSIAEYLTGEFGATVLLVSRRDAGNAGCWAERSQSGEYTPEEQTMYSRLAAMQEQGGGVSVFSGDVADEARMRTLFEYAEDRHGRINGLFHCAGVIDEGGVVRFRDSHSINLALEAKVKGTLILDELAGEFGLDLVVLASSLSVVTHFVNFGQIGYAAANEFLDSFAEYKAGNRRTRTIAVDWESWRENGMAVRASGGSFGNLDGDILKYAISNNEGRDVLSRVLESDSERIIVCNRELPAILRRARAGSAAMAFAGRDGGPDETFTPESIREGVSGIWREILGEEIADTGRSFLHAGGDSLMVVQMVSRLQNKFGVPIEVEDVFNGPSIDEISQTIEGILMLGNVTRDNAHNKVSVQEERVEYKI